MKIKTLLAAVIVMFVFTFTAQAAISVSSTPVTSIRSDGEVEATGAVVLTFQSVPADGTDVVTLDYGVAVDINTISTSKSAATGITVGSITKSGNIVSVPLTFSSATTGSVTISGVRVDVAGTTLTDLSVSISTTVVSIVAGQNTTKVVNGIAAPTSAGKSSDTKAAILDDGTIVVSAGTLFIDEKFASAWTSVTQEAGAADNGYQLKLVIAGGTLPTGVTLDLTAVSSSVSGTVSFSATTLSSSTTKSTISFTDTDLATEEDFKIQFEVKVKTSGSGAISKPLTAINVTATVQSDPDDTTTKIPRFVPTALPSGGQTVFNIVSTITNLLYTFTTWDGSIGFDTGIDVANTSSDPFVVNSATATSGGLTFHFFPRGGGASFSYSTTAGSPGTGLESDGTLASGGSYTVLVSELITAAGQSGPFTGYIIVVCSFTHGHGEGFILDGTTIAQTLNALVIPNSAQTSRKDAAAAGEQLSR
ncbi:hypothetical protein MYX82_04795 [Acidobacteria bacterium AH-259-D05]|nr:hypothetical protein [Acidobacteria bacterium AH-259-D05]